MVRWSEDLIAVEDARTLDGLFFHRVRRTPGRTAYRFFDRSSGTWKELTWRSMERAVSRWATALGGESGIGAGDRAAILLRNCPEWVMFDQAALSLGLVTVPLYTDDRAENAAYILRDSAAKILLVQDGTRWKRLAAALGDARSPRRVVILESGADARRLAAEDERVVVADDWLRDAGGELSQRDGDPGELATIVYTSGTTGRPKGVMLSHRNVLTNAHASLTQIDCYREDVFLSFLPLSHTLERTGGYYLPMMAGATVAYARSVNQLASDLQEVKPTAMIAVPRVFERVYQRLQEQVGKRRFAARLLFRLAVAAGWRRFEREQGRAGWHPLLLVPSFLRRRVAAAVVSRLGGRLRVTVSGGAPLPGEVARLFIGLGLPLLQGYGLTETSPVVSVNRLEDNDPLSVGMPLPGVQLRVGDDDELLIKGPCVMMGYWNNHAATAAMIDSAGWLHSGDQARIDKGRIYITGRLKDILVLSNGEKVPPADLELAIGLDPLFEQVLVVGEGRPYLSALLVLDAELWIGVAREYRLDPDRRESLSDPRIVSDMLARVRVALRGFPGYARIRRVSLMLEPWSVENGLMTPTMKIKRAQVLERHTRQVDGLYGPPG